MVFVSVGDPVAANPDRGPEVFRYDVATGDTNQVTDDALPTVGSWSGYGTALVYEGNGDPLGTNTDHTTEIFRYDLADGSVQQVTRSIGGGFALRHGLIPPNFSPVPDGDARRIYFSSTNSYPDGIAFPGDDGRYFATWLADLDAGTITEVPGQSPFGQVAIDAAGARLEAFATEVGSGTVAQLTQSPSSSAGRTAAAPMFDASGLQHDRRRADPRRPAWSGDDGPLRCPGAERRPGSRQRSPPRPSGGAGHRRYLDDGTDVTAAVAQGTHMVGPLDPGGALDLIAVVTVARVARVGGVGAVAVRATPTLGEGVVIHGGDDKVKARIEVVR